MGDVVGIKQGVGVRNRSSKRSQVLEIIVAFDVRNDGELKEWVTKQVGEERQEKTFQHLKKCLT